MPSIRSVVANDFQRFLSRWANLLLVLVAPSLALVFASPRIDPVPVRVLVAGTDASQDSGAHRLVHVMEESSELEVSTRQESIDDPLDQMRQGSFDLVLNYEGDDAKSLSIYTAETDPLRLQNLERIGAGIWRAAALIDFRRRGHTPGAEQEPLFSGSWFGKPALYEELFMLGVFPVNPLFEYFPQAVNRNVMFLPGTITLLLLVVPFVLALTTVNWHQPWLSTLTWRENFSTIIGKSVLPCTITVVVLLLMLLLIESLYGVHIKAGIFRLTFLVLPGILTSTLLGLSVARLARSPFHVGVVCMLFVMINVILGGFALPLDQRPAVAQALAHAVPSTFIQPIVARWLFGATFEWSLLRPFSWLLLQSTISLIFAIFAFYQGRPFKDAPEGHTISPPFLSPAQDRGGAS